MRTMQAKKVGRPATPTQDVAQRIPGMPRFSIEVPLQMLTRVDLEAAHHDRSRNAEIRVLLGEALDRRASEKSRARPLTFEPS